jgi:urease accessory protein
MSDDSLPTAALLRLCQLVSPALPVGSYNFSQGLEYAVQARWVADEPSALEWIGGLARHAIGTLDLPVLLRLHRAWSVNDTQAVIRWSRFLIAARETRELRAEDQHLGRSLAKVLVELDISTARPWLTREDTSFAALFALASVHWGIADHPCACGYLWSWAENQVLAAVKSIPLGQSAGQRMLNALIREIPRIATDAAQVDDSDIASAAPLHLIASAAHETQYTRLFRS